MQYYKSVFVRKLITTLQKEACKIIYATLSLRWTVRLY